MDDEQFTGELLAVGGPRFVKVKGTYLNPAHIEFVCPRSGGHGSEVWTVGGNVHVFPDVSPDQVVDFISDDE